MPFWLPTDDIQVMGILIAPCKKVGGGGGGVGLRTLSFLMRAWCDRPFSSPAPGLPLASDDSVLLMRTDNMSSTVVNSSLQEESYCKFLVLFIYFCMVK